MNNLNMVTENILYIETIPAFMTFEAFEIIETKTTGLKEEAKALSDVALEVLGVKVSDEELVITSVKSLVTPIPEVFEVPEVSFVADVTDSVVEHLAVEESVKGIFSEELEAWSAEEDSEWTETAALLAEQEVEDKEKNSSLAASSSPSSFKSKKNKKRAKAASSSAVAASSSTAPVAPARKGPSRLAIEPFVVKLSMGGDFGVSLRDSKVAEVLPGGASRAAEKHMFKRLNANYAIAVFVEQNRVGLKGYTFNVAPFKGIFQATDYVIPSSYDHTKTGPQRLHISMFSTFVMHNSPSKKPGLYRLNGVISVDGAEYTIKNFLNLCDIGPGLLNDVDGYVELKGRISMRALLERVREGSKDALTDAKEFALGYQALLNGLKTDVEQNNTKAPRTDPNRRFEEVLLTKFVDRKHKSTVLEYVQGMSRAVSSFVKAVDAAEKGETSLLYAIN